MKILVIGSTGLIGRFVVDALAPLGEVIGISRTTPIKVDVKDSASIKEMYKSVGKFDHLASCIGKVTFKSILDISYDEYLASVKDKAIGQVELV
ncbi:MAG: NAD-dependent epimerase/dehydratase family protein, partial [Actinomycetales bacterium]